MRVSRVALIVLWSLWLPLGFSRGQQIGPQLPRPTPPPPPIPTYSESAGSEYVLLPAQVLDKKGRFVDDLEKKDFRVHVEGVSVDIDMFERDEGAPVSFAFLLDTSGSMRLANKLENAKAAVRTLISQRRPGDDFALFAFAEDEVRTLSNFSPDPKPLLKQLANLEASGQTALFDAVAATTSKMLEGKNGKRAILLFTDGVDNASSITPVQMAEILQQVSIPVYPVGMKNAAFDRLTDEERKDLALDNLKLLAGSSGGLMLLAGGEEDLRPMAEKINADVRKQYLLGFSPSGTGDSKYRVIGVSVVRPGNWIVRARRGYKGSAPAPAPSGGRSSG